MIVIDVIGCIMGRHVMVNGRMKFEPDYILDAGALWRQEQMKVFDPELYKMQKRKELKEYREKQKH